MIFSKNLSIVDKKVKNTSDDVLLQEIPNKVKSLNKINANSNIVINEWIDKTYSNSVKNNKSLISKISNQGLNKSESSSQNKSLNQSDMINSNQNYLYNDQYKDEEDNEKQLGANRAINNYNHKKKIFGNSFLSEIKEKESDYESSYKKNSRIQESDILAFTYNRVSSKLSDSNVYLKNDDSSHLNSMQISMDKNVELSSRNKSCNNRSSKRQGGTMNYILQSGSFTNNTTANYNIHNNNNDNSIINKENSNLNNMSLSNHNSSIINITNSLIVNNPYGKKSYQIQNCLKSSKTFTIETLITVKGTNIDRKNTKTIKEIQDLAGLVKKKFLLHNLGDYVFYNPWDCPTIRESELNEIVKNYHMRSRVVTYCKNSFLKARPNKESKISVKNFDPVKAWICGIQMAAMNIQSLEDDQILINKIFFKLNKGCGFLLKPEHLREGSSSFDRIYLTPLMKLKIDIISCLMLQTCIRSFKKNESIFFESYLVGSWEDDKINPRYKSKSYENNLVNLVFDNESIEFDVYEPELCFWMIKIYLSNTLIARSCIPIKVMNEGIRVVPLFDLNCCEFADCVLIARISKIKISSNNNENKV